MRSRSLLEKWVALLFRPSVGRPSSPRTVHSAHPKIPLTRLVRFHHAATRRFPLFFFVCLHHGSLLVVGGGVVCGVPNNQRNNDHGLCGESKSIVVVVAKKNASSYNVAILVQSSREGCLVFFFVFHASHGGTNFQCHLGGIESTRVSRRSGLCAEGSTVVALDRLAPTLLALFVYRMWTVLFSEYRSRCRVLVATRNSTSGQLVNGR